MKYLLLIFLLMFAKCGEMFCQTNLTIKIGKHIDPTKMMIYYSDGSTFKYSAREFVNHEVVIREPLKSKFAFLGILYPNKHGHLQGINFYINEKKSMLEINTAADSTVNKISNYKATNLIDRNHAKEFRSLRKYTFQERSDFEEIYNIYYRTPSSINDSLFQKADLHLKLKELEYIKLHGNDYFSFAKFTQEIVRPLMGKYLLELYEIFNTVFSEEFKNSYEGKSVKELLEGNLFVKIGMQSPAFKTIDYRGKEISSDSLKGKHYLLSFWATWCSPCIKEIPQIKNIRKTYNQKDLEIISISCDTDSSKFVDGIAKYQMNWSHVFNIPMMGNLFGAKPIPSLYLIGKNGEIIFSSWELALPELDAILKREIGND